MRVAVITEYVRTLPWSHTRWATLIARGLAERGHEVTLICDGLDDERDAEGVRLVRRRAHMHAMERRPVSFVRWARRARERTPHDVSVSLSRLVGADVWAPVGPTELFGLRRLVRPNIVSAAMDGVSRSWLLSAAVCEWATAREAERSGTLRAHIGQIAAPPGRIALGYASTLDPRENIEHLRVRTRRLLEIEENRVALLVPVTHPHRPGLGDALCALAEIAHETDSPPAVLLSGVAQRSLHARAHKAGLGEFVRILGASGRFAAPLAACDAVVLPQLCGPGATGRLASDALRAGRPILCARGAPGDELIDRAPRGTTTPGRVVAPTINGWRGALRRAVDPAWLRETAVGARRIGAGLTVPNLVQRLEKVLEEAALRDTPAHRAEEQESRGVA